MVKVLRFFLIAEIFISPAFYSACAVQNKPEQNVTVVANKEDTPPQNTAVKNPEDVQLPSSPDTLTVALTKNKADKIEMVAPDEVFVKGDGVRVKVSAAEEGFLYIFYKGSSGSAQVLFPGKQYNGGKNEVKANQIITIPGEGWFYFDEKPGVEMVYIIYSKMKDDPIGKTTGGTELTLKTKPDEIVKYLDETGAGLDVFTTSSGNLVRRILLNHK